MIYWPKSIFVKAFYIRIQIDILDYNFSPIEFYSNSKDTQRINNPTQNKKLLIHGKRQIKIEEQNMIKKIYRIQK